MTFDAYRGVLRLAPARRLLLLMMVARVPHTAAALVLALHVVEGLGRSYGEAGLVAAVLTVGIAVGSPWRGRLLDRIGLRRTLVPSILVQAVAWPVMGLVDYAWLFPVVLVAGLFEPPVFALSRTSLTVLVPTEQRRTAFALDSILTDLVYMVGPAAATLAATRAGTQPVLVVVGLATTAACLMLWVTNPPVKAEPVAATAPDAATAEACDLPPSRRPVWAEPGLLLLLAGSFVAMFAITGTDVGLLAALREAGELPALGVVYFWWCAGSVAGGLLYGAWHRSANPMWLLVLLGVVTVPVAVGGSVWSYSVLVLVAGLACAPVLTALTEAISHRVPETRRGEIMGFQGSAYTIGTAAGAPLCGYVIDTVGPWGSFVTVGVVTVAVGLAGAAVLRRARAARELVADAAPPDPVLRS
ncbi:MFS transporter [Antribacter sp. KLBMP9083]|uniref:MFS transporter n=1 Tax=Antribacter soli TaxID=2910976 RepID=A0AA41U7K0_9MICO|nr:MFS transporter [Antribacter soli]MCF4121455.1 MFS transporter [Antribacter soli]